MRKFKFFFFPILFGLIPLEIFGLGQLPSVKNDDQTIKEFIETKISLSQRISQCFQTSDQLPNNDLEKTFKGPPGTAGTLDKIGEKLLLSYLDYVCLIDENDILLVMEEWVGINKLDNFTKGEEVFRINDDIVIKDDIAQSQFPYTVNSPNAIYVEKVDRKNKKLIAKIDIPNAPEMKLDFSDIKDNRTYSPKKGFELNKFVVKRIKDKKYNFSLQHLKNGMRPYEDYVLYGMPESRITGGIDGIERNKKKGIVFLGCQLGGCIVRQYIDSSSECDFNKFDEGGFLICKEKGSYGNTWNAPLTPADTNFVAGKVASYIIENPRFENIRK